MIQSPLPSGITMVMDTVHYVRCPVHVTMKNLRTSLSASTFFEKERNVQKGNSNETTNNLIGSANTKNQTLKLLVKYHNKFLHLIVGFEASFSLLFLPSSRRDKRYAVVGSTGGATTSCTRRTSEI